MSVACCLKMRLLLVQVLWFQVAFALKPNGEIYGNPFINDEDHWFDQKLDHYGPENTKTWKQRYFVNDKHFGSGSPVFLFVGGAETATDNKIEVCDQYAAKFKPLCFVLEHRFYGKSRPKENMSVGNLKSLTTEQALGDLGLFIEGMNRKYNLTRGVNKWVTFGNFYAGSLSAWMRLKLPHLVHAAVAISAPIQAVPEFDFLKKVRNLYESHSPGCWEAISSAIKELETTLKTRPQDADEIFSPCDSFVNATELDVSNLFSILAVKIFGEIVQSNEWSSGIKHVCEMMTKKGLGSPLKRLADVTTVIARTPCLEYKYQKWIERFQNETWQSSFPSGGRQWVYHSCTELGWFETSPFENQTFGKHFPLDFFVQFCSDVFGSSASKERMLSGISLANFMYGGLDIEVRRVVFVHGSINPWHTLGITKSNNPEAPAIFVNGSSDLSHVLEENDSASEQVKAAKRTITDLLSKWLQPRA